MFFIKALRNLLSLLFSAVEYTAISSRSFLFLFCKFAAQLKYLNYEC
jgi:hypothetical protein